MDLLKKIIPRKKEDRCILSLDLGTKVVKALISRVDASNGTITHLGVGKSIQKQGNMIGGRVYDIRGVIDACKEAITQAEKMAGTEAVETIIGMSENTVRTHTHSFETIRQKPQEKIKLEELKGYLQNISDKAKEEIYNNLTYREKERGIKLVSADILDFSIDGYRVLNPMNFKGSRLRVGISVSYVISSDFDIIKEITDQLNLRLLKIAYGPYAVIKALGAEGALGFNAIMIDVGGSITDVVLVKNGNIQKAEMFILGGNIFTKRLANEFGVSEEEAEEIKIRYAKGRLREEDAAKIQKILEEDICLWFSGVEIVLEEFSSKELLPHKILLYGGGIQLPGLAGSLRRIKPGLPFSNTPKLDFLRLNHIASNLDQTERLDDFQDMTLTGLANLSLDDFEGEDAANLLLSEIIL